ncbi:hypothetical protein AGLY_018069 [Aphis glycines]|uniref:Uncharacterized protein n=1 Tax=Aphis glycines TaxID=307491 RepID=A0A6G0ST56_APHGL|nr:hypothetical protein AGLY_018069 [Aphis glycines]
MSNFGHGITLESVYPATLCCDASEEHLSVYLVSLSKELRIIKCITYNLYCLENLDFENVNILSWKEDCFITKQCIHTSPGANLVKSYPVILCCFAKSHNICVSLALPSLVSTVLQPLYDSLLSINTITGLFKAVTESRSPKTSILLGTYYNIIYILGGSIGQSFVDSLETLKIIELLRRQKSKAHSNFRKQAMTHIVYDVCVIFVVFEMLKVVFENTGIVSNYSSLR